jgi:hypothetical protein
MYLSGYYGSSQSTISNKIDELVFQEGNPTIYELSVDFNKETTSSLKTAWEIEPVANDIDELISQAQPGQIWECSTGEGLYILPFGVSLRDIAGRDNSNSYVVRGAEWMFLAKEALSGAGCATIFKHYFPFKLVGEKRIEEFRPVESSLSTVASPEGSLSINHNFTYSQFENVAPNLSKEEFINKLRNMAWENWTIEVDLDKFYAETPLALYPTMKVQASLDVSLDTPRKNYALVFLYHSAEKDSWSLIMNKAASEKASEEGIVDGEKEFDNIDIALSHFQDLLALIQSHVAKNDNQQVLSFEKVSWEMPLIHNTQELLDQAEVGQVYKHSIKGVPNYLFILAPLYRDLDNQIVGAEWVVGKENIPSGLGKAQVFGWHFPLTLVHEAGNAALQKVLSWEMQSDVVNNIDELINIGRPYQVWLSVREQRAMDSCYLYLVPMFQKVHQTQISNGGWYRSVPPDPSEFNFGKTLRRDLQQKGAVNIPYRVFPLKLVCDDWRQLLPSSTSSLKTAWEVVQEFHEGDKVKVLSKSVGVDLSDSGYGIGDTAIVSFISPIGNLANSGYATSLITKNKEFPIIWLTNLTHTYGGEEAFLPTDLDLVDNV